MPVKEITALQESQVLCKANNVMCCRKRLEALKKCLRQGKFQENELNIGRTLGSGGFGSVNEVKFRGMIFAVKKLHQNSKNERATRESFEAETAVLNLRHPNIVHTFAVVKLYESQCILMDFGGERNLQAVINDSGEILQEKRRIKFALDISKALKFAHKKGIAHLDLKPGNVLVTANDSCKLADFGCSQVLFDNDRPASPTKSNLTGTYAYRAPELLKGECPSTSADIYSFSICLWQMLTREKPYGSENQHVIIFGVVAYHLRPQFPTELFNNDLEYKKLVERCWRSNADARPSARSIVKTLKLWNNSMISQNSSDFGQITHLL